MKWESGERPSEITKLQTQILQQGPSLLQCGDWVLTQVCPLELIAPEHISTGTRHYLHGYLMYIDNQYERDWSGITYLFTCNG
jgi:hypothetical protein